MNARKDIYDKHGIGVYHCFSRCVRRAFLCGQDEYSGKNYDHRKKWLIDLLELAASCHVIDVISFSVLDNHFHVVLRNRPDLKKKLTPTAIARRWLLLHPKRRDEDGNACEPNAREIKTITCDAKRVETLRDRLGDISWLMGYVKERLARRANREDGVTGTFFEKRFEMRRLLTENAVLACSIYVDLNPVRAGLAKTPEGSRNTSAYLRIQGMKARLAGRQSKAAMSDRWLAPIHDCAVPRNQRFAEKGWRASDDPGLAITLAQYLKLLDQSGREAKKGKPGKIPDDLAPILVRLGINTDRWFELTNNFDELFRRIAGDAFEVEVIAESRDRRWFHGIENCRDLFSASHD